MQSKRQTAIDTLTEAAMPNHQQKERTAMTFENYEDALDYAAGDVPIWDTHMLPERYFVGHLSAALEEVADAQGWEELTS